MNAKDKFQGKTMQANFARQYKNIFLLNNSEADEIINLAH